jgi:acyl-CoA dehydrogenase
LGGIAVTQRIRGTLDTGVNVDFSVPDGMRPVLDTLRRFIDTELLPREAAVEEAGENAAALLEPLRAKAIELGMFAMNMPQDAGGPGFSTVEKCLIDEVIGRTTTTIARRVFGHVHTALTHCRGEQRDTYLFPAVRGERIGCFALSEPGAGSDAGNLQTRAVKDGDAWVLSGTKHFITDGDIADFAIVLAATGPRGSEQRDVTAFLVDKATSGEANGFRVARVQPMMGHAGLGHAELVLDNCRLGPEMVLGEVGKGFQIAMNSISAVRLGFIGARAVGTAMRLLELCGDYASQRVQFGKRIGEFQLVQQMLADMATEAFAARMMVLNTAWELDQGRDVRDKVSMVKLYSSEMVNRAADRAVQIFGGMGVCRELPIERIYRDSRVLRIYDGTSEIHRGRIGKAIVKRGVEALGIAGG